MIVRLARTTTTLATRTSFRVRSMSSSPPDFKTWTREHLSSLYTAPSDDDFQSAFDSTFSPPKSDGISFIVMNGETLGRDKFRDEIRAQRGAMLKAQVQFDDLQEESAASSGQGGTSNEAESGDGSQPEIVKGKWTVTRSLKFRVRAAPAQMLRISTFEARIEPTSLGVNEYRITHFSETVENKHAPIVLSPGRRVSGGGPNDEAN